MSQTTRHMTQTRADRSDVRSVMSQHLVFPSELMGPAIVVQIGPVQSVTCDPPWVGGSRWWCVSGHVDVR